MRRRSSSSGVALLALLIVGCLSIAVSSAPMRLPRGEKNTAAPPHLAREHLFKVPLAAPEHVLRAGYKHEVDAPRGWARLAHKLVTPGANVTVVAFGGSVTVGYVKSNASYPEELVAWMGEAFPRANVKLVNLARRATAATFAALCLVQDLPEDSDLILFEYSVNGYGGQCQCFTDGQVSGYETLLRKAAKMASMTGELCSGR